MIRVGVGDWTVGSARGRSIAGDRAEGGIRGFLSSERESYYEYELRI